MANIELVIKIPEELYDRFGYEYREENLISKYTSEAILEAFCKGTVLPKGHGRLGDLDALENYIKEDADEWDEYALAYIENAPTIIEADKKEKK